LRAAADFAKAKLPVLRSALFFGRHCHGLRVDCSRSAAADKDLLMSDESPTEDFEHAEHFEHAAHDGGRFMMLVSVTIATLAMVAATVGSFEAIETAATVNAKSEAVFFQDKATDSWNFFQAKSIKKNMYDIAAAQGGDRVADFQAQSKKNEDDSNEIMQEAKKLEGETDAKLRESDSHEHRHQILTIAVTLLHVSIAIATVSIITRGARWPWFSSLILGAAGTIAAGFAYL
jgi:hypothetical protein